MAYINQEKLEALRHGSWTEYNAILGILIAEEVVKQFEEILSPISYCGSKMDKGDKRTEDTNEV